MKSPFRPDHPLNPWERHLRHLRHLADHTPPSPAALTTHAECIAHPTPRWTAAPEEMGPSGVGLGLAGSAMPVCQRL